MYQKLVPRALQIYNLPYDQIYPSQKGYRNEIHPIQLTDGQMVQLTFYKSEPGIVERVRRADGVAKFVASGGLPARLGFDSRMLTLTSARRRVYAGLYYYLPGSTIAWEGYTKTHLKLLGKTMSDMHAVLATAPLQDQPLVVDECLALLGRMASYFNSDGVKQAMADKLQFTVKLPTPRYGRLLEGCRSLPGAQQLHMDFVRGNILFAPASADDYCLLDGLAITGILDFEKTAVGHPWFDVARTLAFLLVDCKYKTSAEIERYFVNSGYQKRGRASLPYFGVLLERLVDFFLMYDLYKFLRHNPYEALKNNEHFVRTEHMLAERGMLHYL